MFRDKGQDLQVAQQMVQPPAGGSHQQNAVVPLLQGIADCNDRIGVVLIPDVAANRYIFGQCPCIGVKIPQEQVRAHAQPLCQPVAGIAADDEIIVAQADLMFFDPMLIPCGKNYTARHFLTLSDDDREVPSR